MSASEAAAQGHDLRRAQAMLRSATKDLMAVIETHVSDDFARRAALMNVQQGAMWANNYLANRIKDLGI